ncbi:MAG: DMT family transporter, partial [Firmicutes bacterium]|nr:DMT family transporter [Bacillota bacterium]
AVCTLGSNEASGVRGIHPVTLLFYNSLFALLPMAFLADYNQLGSFITDSPVYGIGIFALNGIITSLLPNLFVNYSFIHMESGVVSILASGAEPTAALIFGILVFSEIPTFTGFLGMVIVMVSIIVLTASKNEKNTAKNNT